MGVKKVANPGTPYMGELKQSPRTRLAKEG